MAENYRGPVAFGFDPPDAFWTDENAFDSNKPPKNGNNLKSDLRCKSGTKSKSIQTKYNSMARNTTKLVIKNKSLSKPKTTRMNQQPHQMYTTPDVNQIINNNIKLQKGVIIKVEGNRKKKDYIVNSDSNYRTGFTDETCSNSSQQQDNKGAKPFSVIKLAKSKNNTSNSKNKYKGLTEKKAETYKIFKKVHFKNDVERVKLEKRLKPQFEKVMVDKETNTILCYNKAKAV